jgi:hypothetical protein
MKLIEVNKNGTSTFLLNDGRKIKSYQSGYVRIDTKRTLFNVSRLYQINKRIEVRNEYWTGYWHGKGYTDRTISSYKRILIPNEMDRLEYIINWVKKNVK